MFGTRTLITFLGMLALSTAIDPDNICVLVKDGTKIVDDTNCAAFYTCNGGKATSSACPNGQYFSKDNLGCVPKSQATCVSEDGNPCDGISGEKFVSKPNSCSGYYWCKDGVAKEGSCPNGLNFNPNNQMCQYQNEYGCGGGSSGVDNNPDLLCAYIPNGMYFGSASNCKTWLKCTDNIVKSGSCGDNVFNVQTQECVYENSYDCQQLDGDTGETGGAPGGTCETNGEVKAHPDSCSSYWRCVNNQYVTMKCPTGQYYDPRTKKCKNRQNAVNDCDRCEGTSLKFVNAYQDNCEGYLICSGGKKIGSGKCDSGFYFNEAYGSCVKDVPPEFLVCKVILQCLDCNKYNPDKVCDKDCYCTDECPETLPLCKNCDAYDEATNCGKDCVCKGGCKCPPCGEYDSSKFCPTNCECAECPKACEYCTTTGPNIICKYDTGDCLCNQCNVCDSCCSDADGKNVCTVDVDDVDCTNCIIDQ